MPFNNLEIAVDSLSILETAQERGDLCILSYCMDAAPLNGQGLFREDRFSVTSLDFPGAWKGAEFKKNPVSLFRSRAAASLSHLSWSVGIWELPENSHPLPQNGSKGLARAMKEELSVLEKNFPEVLGSEREASLDCGICGIIVNRCARRMNLSEKQRLCQFQHFFSLPGQAKNGLEPPYCTSSNGKPGFDAS